MNYDRLLDQGHDDNGARTKSPPSTRPVAVPLIEQTDGLGDAA